MFDFMKASQVLFAVCLSTIIFCCKEKEEPIQVFPTTDGGKLEVYELGKVHAKDIPVPDQSFTGNIGNIPVSLGRIAGDTLVFIVPDVGEATAQLTVKMGNQIRTWDLKLVNYPIREDQKAFLEGFTKSARDLQTKIKDVDELRDLAEPFGAWIDFFTEKQIALSNSEKVALSGAFQRGRNDLFFLNRHTSFEVPCINLPESTVGSMVYYFGNYDNSYLEDYSKLPKNDFHEAVLSGLGLSFWYQKLLMEYYSKQILECPILQEIKLTEAETGREILPTETQNIEAKVPISYGTIGVFKPLTKSDVEKEFKEIFTYAAGFQGKEYYSRFFSDLVKIYIDDYKWEMPLLNPASIVIAPNDAPVSLGTIKDVRWNPPTINDPAVRLVYYKTGDGKITLVFDSNNREPNPFNFKLSMWTNSFSKEFLFESILDLGCPLSFDVLMIGRTHFLEIESGQPPYQIKWSNGTSGELSQTLLPGAYEVNVLDAEGCERNISFIVPEFGTVQDIDGNVYETVKVGNTWWMTENLRTTRMRNGTAIQLFEANAEWVSAADPAYSWQDNDSSKDDTYGKLYNYHAACCDICPTGWRLPNINEFSALAGIYGLPYGKYIRSVEGWPTSDLKSNNQSGLNFLPSGGRAGSNGNFVEANESSAVWTGYKDSFGLPYIGLIFSQLDGLSVGVSTNPRDGFSVRCVKE